MQVSKLNTTMVGALSAAALFFGGVAQAGSPQGVVLEILTDKAFLDRPDILNFDPWSRSGSTTYDLPFTFTAMGEYYTTVFPSYYPYANYQATCFNDPQSNKMLIDNVLCFRAGHRKASASDASYLAYDNYTTFGFIDYDAAYYQALGLFDSQVYVYGVFRVMTDAGAEVAGSYFADIPDTLKRKKKKIEFTQSAWVDVDGRVSVPGEGEGLDGISDFYGWFQGCEWSGTAKGEAFLEGKSDDGMTPITKPGILEKGNGKLDCDKDATAQMRAKISSNADEEQGGTAVQVWDAVLKKLGSSNKLKIKVDKKGTEDVTEIFDD